MKMSKKILAAAAIVLPLSIGAGSALAYFTANVEASGSASVEVGMDTDIVETFDEWTKHITISSKPGSGAVWIRAKAFCGAEYELEYSGIGWEKHTPDDGYYYYKNVLEPGGTANVLDVKITGVPEDVEEREDFNVVVIYERTPVEYDSAGNALAANWEKDVTPIVPVPAPDPTPAVPGNDSTSQPDTSSSDTTTPETP